MLQRISLRRSINILSRTSIILVVCLQGLTARADDAKKDPYVTTIEPVAAEGESLRVTEQKFFKCGIEVFCKAIYQPVRLCYVKMEIAGKFVVAEDYGDQFNSCMLAQSIARTLCQSGIESASFNKLSCIFYGAR